MTQGASARKSTYIGGVAVGCGVGGIGVGALVGVSTGVGGESMMGRLLASPFNVT
jgi:hypothetical protein